MEHAELVNHNRAPPDAVREYNLFFIFLIRTRLRAMAHAELVKDNRGSLEAVRGCIFFFEQKICFWESLSEQRKEIWQFVSRRERVL